MAYTSVGSAGVALNEPLTGAEETWPSRVDGPVDPPVEIPADIPVEDTGSEIALELTPVPRGTDWVEPGLEVTPVQRGTDEVISPSKLVEFDEMGGRTDEVVSVPIVTICVLTLVLRDTDTVENGEEVIGSVPSGAEALLGPLARLLETPVPGTEDGSPTTLLVVGNGGTKLLANPRGSQRWEAGEC